MKLLKNRNDRVMVGVGSVLAGLALAVVFTSALFDPQFAELSSTSKLFGNSASAAEEPTTMLNLPMDLCCRHTRSARS